MRPQPGKFRLGQIVLVRQPSVDDWLDEYTNGEFERFRSSQRPRGWVSRIVGWSEYHNIPTVALPCRGERSNLCHAEWPYGEDVLEALEVDDWTDGSAWCPEMEVRVILDDDIPQYRKGTIVDACIIAPHIEPEDWYVSFRVPDRDRDAPIGSTWLFHRVVNEREFLV